MNQHETNENGSKKPSKIDVESLSDDEFHEQTKLEEEERTSSKQFTALVKRSLANDILAMVKDANWGSQSELIRELLRREVLAWKQASARTTLARLLDTGKITVDDLLVAVDK